MLDKSTITKHYNDVRTSLENATEDAFNTNLEGDSEKLMLQNMKKKIYEINTDFKREIDELERDSEWNKFCIAFFGETNSGKSTLIDTLRIIFNEELRMADLSHNRESLNRAISDNIQAYSDVEKSYSKFKNAFQQFVRQEEEKREHIAEEIKLLQFKITELQKTNDKLSNIVVRNRNISILACIVLSLIFFFIGRVS